MRFQWTLNLILRTPEYLIEAPIFDKQTDEKKKKNINEIKHFLNGNQLMAKLHYTLLDKLFIWVLACFPRPYKDIK